MYARLLIFAATVVTLSNLSAKAAGNNQLPQDRFRGEWSNENKEGRSLTKITIRKSGDEWTIRAWGACDPEDCDWGETKLNLVGDSVDARDLPYAFATWNHGFSTTHIILKFEAATLVAEAFDIFRDNSQRSNYRSVDRLKKIYSVPQ